MKMTESSVALGLSGISKTRVLRVGGSRRETSTILLCLLGAQGSDVQRVQLGDALIVVELGGERVDAL